MRQLKITKQITNRDTHSLDKYLSDISREGMITPEEEVELAKRIKQGDEKALEKMVRANLRFVVSVAKQYQGQGLSLPDLINEGNLGLIKAAQRFDETKGFKFISYAVWWIRQSILQALAEHARIVRLPLNKIGTINKINRTFSELEQMYEREPTEEELARELEMSPEDIKKILKQKGRHVSMDAPLPGGDDDNRNMYDTLKSDIIPQPDQDLLRESLRAEIERSLSFLSEREADIVKLFYGFDGPPLTLDEIGEKFGLTRERVRQVREKAIRKLRHNARSKRLKPYLG
ncbi:MAG: RNA polymerase sigma factor RpoD/SigA [Bacteroidetes bacterium]|nr:MAG: RNA polymerase sigma factor RpoD/SigA [Bacteroidota bacterium]